MRIKACHVVEQPNCGLDFMMLVMCNARGITIAGKPSAIFFQPSSFSTVRLSIYCPFNAL